MKKINRIGAINFNLYGSKMTIIEYHRSDNIIVQFENDYKVKSTYQHFKDKAILNPYDKSFYNIGYVGEGIYKIKIKNNYTTQGLYWCNLLKRCYDEDFHNRYPTYKECTVTEEWHNFQNFAKWYDEHYYKINDEQMHLDKDILVKGNKIYSPETCVFVPERINGLFIKRQNDRGEYPIGVHAENKTGKFIARCNISTGRKYLGLFNTPNEAFYLGYKPFKESYIKQVAEDYKNKIPIDLYNALYKYEVEITD